MIRAVSFLRLLLIPFFAAAASAAEPEKAGTPIAAGDLMQKRGGQTKTK